MNPFAKPVIVLVHGALTDASIWSPVIAQLQNAGYRTIAPALPLRGLASDQQYLRAFLRSVAQPVVLVGHSYAGAVISGMSDLSDRLRSLVYVCAFQPDTGESAGELNGRFPGSRLTPDTLAVLESPTGSDIYLREEFFSEVYAADVTASTAAIMAATQRPIDSRGLEEALEGEPAWKTVPSWSIVTTEDFSIRPATLRYMAARAGSHVVEVQASHAVPVSQPHAVTNVIVEASGG